MTPKELGILISRKKSKIGEIQRKINILIHEDPPDCEYIRELIAAQFKLRFEMREAIKDKKNLEKLTKYRSKK